MTEEERKYKIEQIETYEELSESERKKENLLCVCAGITLIIAINAMSFNNSVMDSSATFALNWLSNANLIGTVTLIKYMINAISKKTVYEQQIINLSDELLTDAEKNEENINEENKTRGGK